MLNACQPKLCPRQRCKLLIVGIAAAIGMTGACSDLLDPHVSAALPSRAASGAWVDLVGERFSGQQRAVHFGGVPAHVALWQPRRARVRVPTGISGSVLIVVTVDGRRSNAVDFFASTPPQGDGG